MKKIRILLVDDHTILRDSLRVLLENEPDMIIAGEAEEGRTAVRLTCQLLPDVVLLDIALPLLGGLEALRQIKHACPDVKVLILTMHENEEYIRQSLAFGAMGYLLKDSSAQELIDAIHAVYRGETILSPAVTRLVIENYLRWGEVQKNNSIRWTDSS